MNNPHIIVGEPRRCLCGMYGEKPICCKQLLGFLDDLVKHANIKGSGVSLYVANIRLLDEVIRSLVQECDDPLSKERKLGY